MPSGVTRVETFPMGIDFDKSSQASESRKCRRSAESLARLRRSSSLSTGSTTPRESSTALRFRDAPRAKSRIPGECHPRVIVVPSRSVEQYEAMKKQIEELVGKINGHFGTMGWTPVLYQYRYLSFNPLAAHVPCQQCGAGHAAARRDEPCREGVRGHRERDQTGVLVLSEMAGRGKGAREAIVINPNNREEIAEALREALEMPAEEQKRRNHIMRARLKRYNVTRWANDFVITLVHAAGAGASSSQNCFSSRGKTGCRTTASSLRGDLFSWTTTGHSFHFTRRPSLARPRRRPPHLLAALARHRNTTWFLSAAGTKNACSNGSAHPDEPCRRAWHLDA